MRPQSFLNCKRLIHHSGLQKARWERFSESGLILRHFSRASLSYNRQMPAAASLEVLNSRIIACEACPRLRAYTAEIARVRRRQWRDWSYWGRPFPSFGDPKAQVLVFGLAPGAHGSNRTGRPFTGDGSGNFMFPVLYEAGFASQPNSESRDDGLKLKDMWISAAVRCAPPGNKPTPEEQRNCAHWLDEEMALLTRVRVVVCLGKIG